MTVATGIEVLRALTLSSAWREREGETFVLELQLAIPREDTVEDGVLSLIVDRIDFSKGQPVAYTHKNRDDIIETSARITTEGESFEIDLRLPYGRTSFEGASVTTSPEMERIMLEHMTRTIVEQASQSRDAS